MLSKPRIVCAAIRAEDGSLIVGIRHYSPDMYAQINVREDGSWFKHRSGDDQGFVDQHGKYYTREEAWHIASKNNQLNRLLPGEEGVLYSENLY